MMTGRETSNLEYKEEISNTFLKTVSAFANYETGKIIFGVNDEGQTVGLKGDLDQLCLNIENKINDSIKPAPDYRIKIDEKKKVIEVQIFEGDYKPYVYKNKAYKRADAATVEVERLEYNRLVLEGTNTDYEELAADTQELSFKILEGELKSVLGISELNEDIMKTMDLYSDKKGYNKAAELLADRNECPGVDIVRFGNSIDEFLDRENIENVSIIEQYHKAISIYRKYYQYEVIEGSQRRKVERLPEKAFREALANSIVHRVWDVKVPIRIAMDKDKIEIISPGGLPVGISKEEYLKGQVSILRNPILGNVFFRLNYIERFGTGVKRINQSYEKSVIKPEFSFYENSLSVTLPLLSLDIGMLDEAEQSVYLALEKEVAHTRETIEKRTNLNKSKVIRVLNRLIEMKMVEKTGVGRGVKYRLL
ncbi:ATP-dependent DNA helicase RecG [Lachnospiraceae bacterium PM6-15]|uniref:RNA-binding domain-containing protein n=1 Tax=Ohessyouella blattaphilus TaxID=2949333 RepID=UPI003E2E6FBE